MRILVTHGLGFLSQCDKIVTMKGGRIKEVGTYAELMDRAGAFAEYVHNYGTSEGNEEDDPSKLHVYNNNYYSLCTV